MALEDFLRSLSGGLIRTSIGKERSELSLVSKDKNGCVLHFDTTGPTGYDKGLHIRGITKKGWFLMGVTVRITNIVVVLTRKGHTNLPKSVMAKALPRTCAKRRRLTSVQT